MIKPIPSSAWSELESVFRDEFNSDLPLPEHGTIYGAYEDGKLQAFVLVEDVKFIGQLGSIGKVSAVKELVDFLQDEYGKMSVATVASEPRFAGLYNTLGMSEIPGTLYRKN